MFLYYLELFNSHLFKRESLKASVSISNHNCLLHPIWFCVTLCSYDCFIIYWKLPAPKDLTDKRIFIYERNWIRWRSSSQCWIVMYQTFVSWLSWTFQLSSSFNATSKKPEIQYQIIIVELGMLHPIWFSVTLCLHDCFIIYWKPPAPKGLTDKRIFIYEHNWIRWRSSFQSRIVMYQTFVS